MFCLSGAMMNFAQIIVIDALWVYLDGNCHDGGIVGSAEPCRFVCKFLLAFAFGQK